MKPEDSPELAQIHYLLNQAAEWNGGFHQSVAKICKGDVTAGAEHLESHIETCQHLAGRLRRVIEAEEQKPVAV